MQWKQVASGVWKVSVGKPEAYNLLTAAGAQPNTSALKNMGTTGFPLNQNEISVQLRDGKTYLRIPLERGEQLFGFGLNFQTVHQRGKILQLHMDHYGNKDNGRTHAPVPFYVSSKGYGVFVNSARYINVYAGTAVGPTVKIRPCCKTVIPTKTGKLNLIPMRSKCSCPREAWSCMFWWAIADGSRAAV